MNRPGWHLALVTLLLGCQPLLTTLSAADPYAQAVEQLTKRLLADRSDEAQPLRVAVGGIRFERTEFESPFSGLVKQELELALGNIDQIKVVAREHLADLQLEQRFQQSSLVTEGTEVEAVNVDGAEVIVRGNYFVSHPTVTLFAELVKLDGGSKTTAKIVLTTQQAAARLVPPEVAEQMVDDAAKQQAALAQSAIPHNLVQGEKNYQAVQKLTAPIPQEFPLFIDVVGDQRAFVSGEYVRFSVTPGIDCHIAVFVHQSDGSSVLLYPNQWSQDTAVRGGQTVKIPGDEWGGFAIQVMPPYGNDVVQVIATNDPGPLHQKIQQMVKTTRGLSMVNRTELGELLKKERGLGLKGSGQTWSTASVTLSTYPRVGP